MPTDPAPAARPVAVVDVDGVLADVTHRLHHLERRPRDWEAFFAAAADDPALEDGLALAAQLAVDSDVVLLTGRPERLRALTEAWLDHHGVTRTGVLMRRDDDRRPAGTFKLARLRQLARGRLVALVVDDDPVVAEVVRAAGFPVRLVAWGRPTVGRDRDALHDAQEVDGRT